MPQFNAFKDDSRELMVRFTCRRCRHQVIEELTDSKISGESYGYLRYIKAPEGWDEHSSLYNGLLCPRCSELYEKFMNNERMEGET
jgi:hypothetical protein